MAIVSQSTAKGTSTKRFLSASCENTFRNQF
jgi:hypothetical protein